MMERIYKTDSPLSTISRVRNILTDMDLFIYERCWANPYNQIYSMRVECDEEAGSFGTNGKGRNRLFCAASGYAEFIERLQNLLVSGATGYNRRILSYLKKLTGFYYYPDESLMSKEEFKRLPRMLMDDFFPDCDEAYCQTQIDALFNIINQRGDNGLISVPFYNPATDSIVYLPYNFCIDLTGSNGMAAGNCAAEGVFQGLCEIIERYAGALVYQKRLTPPTVSREYLSQYPEEYAIIEEIESQGYHIEVKDFSAGLRLPALGVMMYNSNKTKYRLNVGAETSFKFALSRVLTEINQGNTDKDFFESLLLDVPVKEYDFMLEDSADAAFQRESQFSQFVLNGRGLFPYALFEEKESYAFDPTVFTHKRHYQEEVQTLVNSLQNMGHDVYIRDVSFLGFPSYYVFIPGISMLGQKHAEAKKLRMIGNFIQAEIHDRAEETLFNLHFLNDRQKILDLLKSIAPLKEDYLCNDAEGERVILEEVKLKDYLKLEFDDESVWGQIPLSFVSTILCFLIGEYDNAIKALKIFMRETTNEENDYYKDILKYLELRSKGIMPDSKSGISAEVINDFAHPERLFDHLDLPCCPDCQHCKLAAECQTRGKLTISQNVAKKMNRNLNQMHLRDIFYPAI